MPKIQKTDAEWKALLAQKGAEPLAFDVTRHEATERAFTGRYWDCHEPGQYRCTCCGASLFSSEHKFDSGCGWPSFTKPLEKNHVIEKIDTGHGMVRTEVRSKHAGSHLGHVFNDGPAETGLRYCINSASLKFEKK